MQNTIDSTEQVLERNGYRLHYWLQGPADRPLVVFTHGATLDHRMFDAQIAALVAEYRVLSWDVRGHGRSQPLGASFSIRGAAYDLLAILDQIGVAQAAFVGQSMGGYIVQELAFVAPQRAVALVMIGCACTTLKLSAGEAWAIQMSLPLLGMYSERGLRQQIARRTAITPAVRAYALDACSQVSKHDFLTIWGGLTRCLHYEPGYRIRQPLLLTVGAYDDLGNFKKIYPLWADRDTNGFFVVIPEAGHNANQDNPGFFNALLLDFLREHLPSTIGYEQHTLSRATLS